MNTKIKINKNAQELISLLQHKGYKAYIVGGCVRDSLLGVKPKDWDICTSATVEDMKKVFRTYPVYNTGEKHGTLTVGVTGEFFEVTTFRKDGKYSDSRHPDSVEFVSDISEDLARRDFTINAMAYNDIEGLIDPFSGIEDLNNGTIKCVGNADLRFKEDALRILRAIRFSAKLGFDITEQTLLAMYNGALLGYLNKVSVERKREEIIKIIDAPYAFSALYLYSGIICSVFPYLAGCVCFDQNNKYHSFDVYTHSITALSNYTGNNVNTKIALLLHDVGKPACYTEDENGGHFHGHPVVSEKYARIMLEDLKFSNKDKEEILTLIANHNISVEPTKKSVKKALNKFGIETYSKLLDMQAADISAHSPINRDSRLEAVQQKKALIEEIMQEEACFSLKDLAVNGNDLINIGLKEGKQIGEILNFLLNSVINGEENSFNNLINLTKKYLN